MLQEISTKKLGADFYAHDFDDKLKLVYSADVTVNFPDYRLDQMESKRLEMNLGMFAWLKGLGR